MIHNLSTIYPDSILNPPNNEFKNNESYYLVEVDTDKLYISMDSLNFSEIDLLNLLTQKNQLETDRKGPFEKLLFDGVVDELLTIKKIRLVYLQTNHLEETSFTIWKKTLMDSFIEIIDVIAINSDLIVAVFDANDLKKNLLKSFSEVIQSLDQDFNLLTLGMIGQIVNVNPQTQEIFEHEKNIFLSFIDNHQIDGITMLSDLLIHNVGSEFKKGTVQLPTLLNHLYEDKEIQQLIYTLFKNDGNLSQTANVLYLHRNTLSYRIDQLYQKTGFDLTYLPDLIICYLLIV